MGTHPKRGLRVSAVSLPFAHEVVGWPSAAVAKHIRVFEIRMSSSLLKCLILMVASVVKTLT